MSQKGDGKPEGPRVLGSSLRAADMSKSNISMLCLPNSAEVLPISHESPTRFNLDALRPDWIKLGMN
jgi:hypothetical protein